ncbi:MAG: hypothetical protein ABI113_18960 [Mucilaginibacter sp.]
MNMPFYRLTIISLLNSLMLFCYMCAMDSCQLPQTADQIRSKQPDTAAYEDIHFGILAKDYVKLKKSSTLIGTSLFTFSPFFIPKDQRLCMLQLRSVPVNYQDALWRLPQDIKAIREQFVTLYGGPAQSHEIPRIENLDQRHVFWDCEWVFPRKLISIGVGRIADENAVFAGDNRRYLVVCQIIDRPLHDIYNEQVVYTDMPF